jgi:hypothetical protein
LAVAPDRNAVFKRYISENGFILQGSEAGIVKERAEIKSFHFPRGKAQSEFPVFQRMNRDNPEKGPGVTGISNAVNSIHAVSPLS